MGEAREIYQRLLDEIDTAILERDQARYVSYFSVPHRMETFETTFTIKSEDHLREIFEDLVRSIESIGVAQLIRHCKLAEFGDPDTIWGCHQTKLVNTSNVIVDEYDALSKLERQGGRWRVAESQYAEKGTSIPSRIMK